MKKVLLQFFLIGWFLISYGFLTPPAYPASDSGRVPSGWSVWSCWYWPYDDDYNPNLYDDDEAMHRYDYLIYLNGEDFYYAQWWEYDEHGPPQNPDPWWGHCHAWAGASVWEDQPTKSRKLNGVTFRIRDRKGLIIESYFNCADGNNYELYADNPSPGLFWRYLRREIKGVSSLNPMHGHGMGFVGELYYGDEVWNYPIYKYSVSYQGTSSNLYGKMTVYVAADSDPSFADSKTLYYQTFTYQFEGVKLDSTKNPTDSGKWIGSGPYSRPDAIWRPEYPPYWTTYVKNEFLDEDYLSDILNTY